MKRGFVILFIFLILSINISIISASFSIGNLSHSINQEYSIGNSITGWINISLNNEPSDSELIPSFDDNAGEPIRLLNLIDEDTNFVKTCIPENCEISYVEVSGSEGTEKNFVLNPEEEKIFGFKIDENNFNSADYFSINITSNAQISDLPQLKIDILNDGVIEWESYKAFTGFGERQYGCYSPPATGEAQITDTEYCEKITLSPSSNVSLGAEIINGDLGGGNAELRLRIYNSEDANCEVTVSSPGAISCSPKNFRIKEKGDFNVCISALSGSERKYAIRYEKNAPCGFTDESLDLFDFEIFARTADFAPVGNFILDDDELKNFENYNDRAEDSINSYISEIYDNVCSGGCIIPIKFISSYDQSQEISISYIKLDYTAGISTSTNILYNITETLAKVNADFQKLYLDQADIRVPVGFDDYVFKLNLNNDEIFSEEISVKRMAQITSLNPKTIMAAYPTKFTVQAETANTNITGYKWEFGDGDIQTTLENSVTHTYYDIGELEMTISIMSQQEVVSSRTFNINIEVPKTAVNLVLADKEKKLDNIKEKTEILASFYKESVNSILDVEYIEEELQKIKERNESASSDEDYIGIMESLMYLEIPDDIVTTATAPSISFYPKEEDIDLDIVKEITGESITIKDESEYKNAIMTWNYENLDTKISFDELSAVYDDFDEPIVRIFTIDISKETFLDYDPYFIIYSLEDLKFDEDEVEEVSEYYYIELKDDETSISFSTTEDIDFIEVPAFISPSLSKLNIVGWDILEDKPIALFIIAALVGLILIGIFVYVMLQQWYKKKYEKYLFKNKNDLYNLVSYIQGAKKEGIKESKIYSRLRKAGWKSEQIRYVLKKYVGKRTGMLELPITKVLEKLKKKKPKTKNKKRKKK